MSDQDKISGPVQHVADGCQKKGSWDDDRWFSERSIPVKVLMVLGFIFLGFIALLLLGFVTMWLWNWLMPDIFGLKQISYWQAWGLLALSGILLKSWGGGGKGSERKRKKQLRRSLIQTGPAVNEKSE